MDMLHKKLGCLQKFLLVPRSEVVGNGANCLFKIRCISPALLKVNVMIVSGKTTDKSGNKVSNLSCGQLEVSTINVSKASGSNVSEHF